MTSLQSDEQEKSNANVKVVVRIRPINSAEQHDGYSNVTEAISDHMLVFDPKVQHVEGFLQTQHRNVTGRRFKDLKYAFDHVLKSSATNRDVFEKTTQSIVKALLNGYNCSVFAYGATGSGKTHTMLGNEQEPGVIYHTMVDLYKQIDMLKDEKIFNVAVSYLEIYNETVRDLLHPKKNLPIREDKVAGVVIAGLSLHKPNTAEDLLHMLQYGNRNRSQHPTDANAESSRSHAVFQVFVKQRDRSSSGNNQLHMAKMCLVDLAGSERAIQNRNEGARFREGANINRSLLALGNVINALASKSKGHVPYRDSKLTRLLKDSLGGNCQTVMIATVSPSSRSYDDTYNTLRYADRAKHIRADLTKNVVSIDQHIVNYKRYVADLERENHDLRDKTRLLQESLKTQAIVPVISPQPVFVRQFQERLQELFKCRKELMKSQMTSEVVKRELKWKLSRKERTIRRIERLTNVKDIVNKHQRLVDRMQRRCCNEEVSLVKTTQKLREHDKSIYDLSAEVANLSNVDKTAKELLTMSVRFHVTESYLHDVDIHLSFVKKMARAQERQSAVNERLILSLIKMVKKQQDVLKNHNICSPEMDQEYNECCFLVEERGVSWAQSKLETGKQENYFEGEEKEDLRISSVIDMQLPKIDLTALRLGNLNSSPALKRSSHKPVRQDVMSSIGLGQTCVPRRVEKVQPSEQTSLPTVDNVFTEKTQRPHKQNHLTKASDSLIQNSSPHTLQRQSLDISKQTVDGLEVTKNCISVNSPEGGTVKKMVEIYSKGICLSGSKFDSLKEQSLVSGRDNSVQTKLTSRKCLQWPADSISTLPKGHSNTVDNQFSPPMVKDDPPSENMNQTFEIEKPAIPNTPCIDSPIPKHRRISYHSYSKENTPLQTKSSRGCLDRKSHFSCRKSKQLSSEKNQIGKYQPNISSQGDSQEKIKTERIKSRSLINRLDTLHNVGCSSSPVQNSFSKKVTNVQASTSTLVKRSPSLSKWENSNEQRAKSKVWHSSSAQQLGKDNSNNSSTVAENEDLTPFCSTPESSLKNEVVSSTPRIMEVEICSPVVAVSPNSTQSTKGKSEEQTAEDKNEEIQTPEFKINPYMQTVIQSLKKHGLPSLTERLSIAPTSAMPAPGESSSTSQNPILRRDRSPLHLLDVNSSKYHPKKLTDNKNTLPEKASVEQVTLQPQQITQSNNSNPNSLKNRLNKLKERRLKREHAAKPYSRESILANRGQRLAAALQRSKGPLVSTNQGPVQGILTSTSTVNKPSYMLSTFAASQKFNGSERDKDKGPSTVFAQAGQPQRRPFTGLRNQTSLPWLKSS